MKKLLGIVVLGLLLVGIETTETGTGGWSWLEHGGKPISYWTTEVRHIDNTSLSFFGNGRKGVSEETALTKCRSTYPNNKRGCLKYNQVAHYENFLQFTFE